MAVRRWQADEADATEVRDRRASTAQHGKCRRLIWRYGRIIVAAAPSITAVFSAPRLLLSAATFLAATLARICLLACLLT